MRARTVIGVTALLVSVMPEIASSDHSRSDDVEASPARVTDPWERVRKELKRRGLDPNEIVLPGMVTPEMESWARAQISAETPREIADELLSALIDPERLGLQYSSDFTGTAVEVFETRRANCLAFTHLYVGLSRALGLPTFYVYWNRIERYRRDQDLVVVSGHMSAGQGSLNDLMVLRFGAVAGLEARGVTPISDLNALARHYSNRSVELLSRGDLNAAVQSGELATRIDPMLADAWINLGVAKRRADDWAGAEKAYLEASAVSPDNSSAYQNLRVLYSLRGDQDAADQLLTLLEQRGCRDPFVYLELGDESLAADSVEEAGRYYRRAYKHGRELAETCAARGNWYLVQGDMGKARKWLRRAQSIDANEKRTRELERRLRPMAGNDGSAQPSRQRG